MARLIFSLTAVILCCLGVYAQDYNIRMEGYSTNGSYYVKITTVLDKKQYKTSNDYIKKMAVDGVMLRGIAAGNGYSTQRPLIEDPDIVKIKSEFFNAFNDEGQYNNFCIIEPTSVSVTELQKKKYEVSALVTVDKERLLKYLSEHQIIKDFDSLW